MALCLECELSIPIFWDITPKEALLYIQSYIKRKKAEHEKNIQLAWFNAGLRRAKKFPKLNTILKPEPKAVTPEMKKDFAMAKEIAKRINKNA